MMYCPACGNQLHEAAASCPACGRPNSLSVQGGDVASTSWFGFRGRISRQEYWLHYVLPLTVIPIVAAVVDGVIHAHGVLSGIMTLVLVLPSIAGYVKRAHDRNRSGWFVLIVLVPFAGMIWVLIELGCLRGTPGPNRFGRDPLRSVLPYGGAGQAFS